MKFGCQFFIDEVSENYHPVVQTTYDVEFVTGSLSIGEWKYSGYLFTPREVTFSHFSPQGFPLPVVNSTVLRSGVDKGRGQIGI